MTNKMATEGLCVCCDTAQECSYAGHFEAPRLFCEEARATSAPRKAVVAVTRNPAGSGTVRGLCRLCDRRESCALRGAREEVWHCEEYR